MESDLAGGCKLNSPGLSIPSPRRKHTGTRCEELHSFVHHSFINAALPVWNSYSMPSTHSATISHFAVYIELACLFLPIHPSFPLNEWTRYLPPFLVIPWALEIIRSRIWLGHHTWQQCAVGVLYGTVFSFAWFALWVNGANEYGRIVEEQIDRLILR